MNELFDFLIKKDVKYKTNQTLADYTSVRIGGPVSVVAFPHTIDQLIDLVRFLRVRKIRYTVVGFMTNVLPCDEEYRGVLIVTKRLDRYLLSGNTVFAECGVAVSSLINHLSIEGLGGCESLCGIPGTLGGMIVSNAGAYGCEIGDVVKSVSAYSPTADETVTLKGEDLLFSYRSSVFANSDMLILSAVLELIPSDRDIISAKMGMIRQRRASSQPLSYPSLGSVFKRVSGISAGQIIDECGLKGLRVGGAMVSPIHAGFIVNVGGATADDFCKLVNTIKDEVYKRRGICLEEEIKYISHSAAD
jgi:UDP-N-acetylmuramate dehydrogenase